LKNQSGHAPCYYAGFYGHTSCVREMLGDSRVKVNEPTNSGSTSLHRAARWGRLDAIKWWIASGREMDLGAPGDIDKTDAIGAARQFIACECGRKEVVLLLLADPRIDPG